jgi:hypothetical protein
MKFERTRGGEYRAQLENGQSRMYISVFREGRQWYWCFWGFDNGNLWETDDYGPFPTKKEAIADAIANYEDFLD